MCCIMGTLSDHYPKEKIIECFDRTKSRGPDDTRIERAGSGYLCFHRLSIMGLDETGMQPFSRGKNKIVCNGELYGWRKQREALEKRGYSFISGSDCELLLPMYEEYGLEMFRYLDSEFALILYDGESGQLIAARDPIGIRPLYYGYFPDGAVAFASEAQDLTGLCEKIMPFPPGHYYADGKFTRYADLTTVSEPLSDDLETVCSEIREKLKTKKISVPEKLYTGLYSGTFIETVKWWFADGCRDTPETVERYFEDILS